MQRYEYVPGVVNVCENVWPGAIDPESNVPFTPVTVSYESERLTHVTVLFTPMTTVTSSGEYAQVTGVSSMRMRTEEPDCGCWGAGAKPTATALMAKNPTITATSTTVRTGVTSLSD